MGGAVGGRQISLSRGDGNSTGLCTSDGCAVIGVVGDGVGGGFGSLFSEAAVCHLLKNFARRDGGIEGVNFGRRTKYRYYGRW